MRSLLTLVVISSGHVNEFDILAVKAAKHVFSSPALLNSIDRQGLGTKKFFVPRPRRIRDSDNR